MAIRIGLVLFYDFYWALSGRGPIALRVARPRLLKQKLPNDEGVGGQRGRMGKGREPVPIT